jgi:RNA polymerase sigma-70 factor, ECF subfamily
MSAEADLDRARRGDRAAFGRLVRLHQRRVYATTLHILGNHSDADDATQEVFVRAYRGLAAFDGRADFFTWLYRIAVNTALNALRTAKRGTALAHKGGEEAAHLGGRPEAGPGRRSARWTPPSWAACSRRWPSCRRRCA